MGVNHSMEDQIPLILLANRLAVSRLPAQMTYPDWAQLGSLTALIRTPDELTVVCEERYVPPEVKAERGWRVFQVQGPLDFALVGILASITRCLAAAGVSVFALSTFDTDYVLVKEESLKRAVSSLEQAGFPLLNV